MIGDGSLINTIEQETYEIEHHLHNNEIWFGSGASEDSLTPYQITSGNNDFGTEVLILDTGDTPFRTGGMLFFDIHRLKAVTIDETSLYLVRIIYGTGTVGEAETAKQYTTVPLQKILATGTAQTSPVPVMKKRNPVGTKIWCKIKNVTNGATLDLIFGLHEYLR